MRFYFKYCTVVQKLKKETSDEVARLYQPVCNIGLKFRIHRQMDGG